MTPRLDPQRLGRLHAAAADFFFLLNRGYPRTASLELAGNRHGLDASERMLLSRGVFSQQEALTRRAKRRLPPGWRRELLAVDGHNVQITVESRLYGKPLLKANDGALRDIAGLSSRYRMTETSAMAMDMVVAFLKMFPPKEVLFLFDAPMSRSGEFAALYRKRLAEAGIRGEAKTNPVPEREFPYHRCIAASSDRAVLDSAHRWTDLACLVIDYFGPPEPAADFSGLLLARSAGLPP
ncbi:MAG: DUF434 domain-containing protein [Syntrophobacteraceae bacterium]